MNDAIFCTVSASIINTVRFYIIVFLSVIASEDAVVRISEDSAQISNLPSF